MIGANASDMDGTMADVMCRVTSRVSDRNSTDASMRHMRTVIADVASIVTDRATDRETDMLLTNRRSSVILLLISSCVGLSACTSPRYKPIRILVPHNRSTDHINRAFKKSHQSESQSSCAFHTRHMDLCFKKGLHTYHRNKVGGGTFEHRCQHHLHQRVHGCSSQRRA